MALTSNLVRQAAAIPIRGGQLCLVTARRSKRWVIPKGCLEDGKLPSETAQQEAWEEAGLSGSLDAAPVGNYLYEKAGCTCVVTVFVLRVSAEAQRWPEDNQRQRVWVPLADALNWIEEPGLREIIRELGA